MGGREMLCFSAASGARSESHSVPHLLLGSDLGDGGTPPSALGQLHPDTQQSRGVGGEFRPVFCKPTTARRPSKLLLVPL